MNNPKHIALIGCGFTGTSAFYQLVDKYPVSEITIFEATGDFGPGYAYRTNECDDYLINNTTDTMCLTPDNKRAFYNWLCTRPDLIKNPDPKGHLPRTYFGLFLKDVFKSTLTMAAIKNIKINLVPSEVTDINEADNHTMVKWHDGSIKVDMTIMTTGRCPDIDKYEHPDTSSNIHYFPTHIKEDRFKDIPLDGNIHVLGASLSAYDVVNRLYSPKTGCSFKHNSEGEFIFYAGKNERTISLCSRSGRLKKMKSVSPFQVSREHFTLNYFKNRTNVTLSEIASQIKKDCERYYPDINWDEIINPYASCTTEDDLNRKSAQILENDIKAAKSNDGSNILVDLFGDAAIDLWDIFALKNFNINEEKEYRRKFETAALTYEASCPISTAEKLLSLHKAGRLKIIKGVTDITLEKNGYIINHEFGKETATYLINTTGSVNRDLESKNQPELIKNMKSNKLIEPYKRNGEKMLGINVDLNNFKAKGSNRIYVANMLLWGPGFFTSSAIMMATVIDRILKSAFERT